ncbi:MAG: hypothetical protein DIU80_014770 [Chloroflexota bacterium]
MFVLRPIPHHFVIWLLLAPLLLMEVYTLDSFLRLVALQDASRARTALAEVVEHRSGSRGPEIRYRFGVAGSPATYHARSPLSSSSQWVPISPAAWEQAQRTGSIPVRYLPEDPWTNQPAGRVGHPVADSFCLWGLFLIFDLIWVAESYLIARNFARCLAMVERREPYRTRFWESRQVADRRYALESWHSAGGHR